MPNTSAGVVNLIRESLHPLTGRGSDYDPLIQQIGKARFVLIGEASHGSHEFYRERAQITKRLIQERGFTAVISLREKKPVVSALNEPRLERAIGVIYRPETERQSHYFYARLSDQVDALLHFDQTRAVEPLERTPEWSLEVAGEPTETFPSGL